MTHQRSIYALQQQWLTHAKSRDNGFRDRGQTGGRKMSGASWRPKECQFPRGDKGSWDFCCEAVMPNKPYCAEHCAVCYKPTEQEKAGE